MHTNTKISTVVKEFNFSPDKAADHSMSEVFLNNKTTTDSS